MVNVVLKFEGRFGKTRTEIVPQDQAQNLIRKLWLEEGLVVKQSTFQKFANYNVSPEEEFKYAPAGFAQKDYTHKVVVGDKVVGVSPGVAEKIEKEVIPKQEHNIQRQKQIESGVITTPKIYSVIVGDKVVGVSPGVAEKIEKEIVPKQEHDIRRELQIERKIVKPTFKERVTRSYEKTEAKLRKYSYMLPEIPSSQEVKKTLEKGFENLNPKEKAIYNVVFGVPTKIIAQSKRAIFDTDYYESKKNLPGAEEGVLFVGGTASGAYREFREKPLKTSAIFGASFLLPKFLGSVGKAASATKLPLSSIGGQLSTVAGGIIKGASVALPAYYAYSVGKRIDVTPGGVFEKGETTGAILSTEFIPMVAGGYLGSKFWSKFEGYTSTIGRKELKESDLVPRDVLTGKEIFPKAGSESMTSGERALIHKGLFEHESFRLPSQEKPLMYHATPQRWQEPYITRKGSSYIPGTFGSYGISPSFLKLPGGKISFYGGSLFQPYKQPGVMAIEPKGFSLFPKEGYAYIPGKKTEVEAIIAPEEELFKTGTEFFFKTSGVRVPIDQFKVEGLIPGSGMGSFSTLSSSYSLLGSYPITTPGHYLFGSLLGSSEAKTSSKKIFYSSDVKSSIKLPKGDSLILDYEISKNYELGLRSYPGSSKSKKSYPGSSEILPKGSGYSIMRLTSKSYLPGYSKKEVSMRKSSIGSLIEKDFYSDIGVSKLSNFNLGLPGSRKGKSEFDFIIPTKRKLGYAPTLLAVEFNVFGEKPPEPMSGIEQRPKLKKKRRLKLL